MEWVELFESLPISNVVILGLAYACWNIYKDTQTVTDRVNESWKHFWRNLKKPRSTYFWNISSP